MSDSESNAGLDCVSSASSWELVWELQTAVVCSSSVDALAPTSPVPEDDWPELDADVSARRSISLHLSPLNYVIVFVPCCSHRRHAFVRSLEPGQEGLHTGWLVPANLACSRTSYVIFKASHDLPAFFGALD